MKGRISKTLKEIIRDYRGNAELDYGLRHKDRGPNFIVQTSTGKAYTLIQEKGLPEKPWCVSDYFSYSP
jgi:hypothetical protein